MKDELALPTKHESMDRLDEPRSLDQEDFYAQMREGTQKPAWTKSLSASTAYVAVAVALSLMLLYIA